MNRGFAGVEWGLPNAGIDVSKARQGTASRREVPLIMRFSRLEWTLGPAPFLEETDGEAVDQLALPILKIFVPHVGQVPSVAGRPFFMVIDFAPLISFFARHLTQYPSTPLPPPCSGITPAAPHGAIRAAVPA
jgi:hypothetical protein